MESRIVGRSGLRVSAAGLGCNNFGRVIDENRSGAIINAALDAGVTVFDTAPIYGRPYGASEEILGRSLGARRSEATIVTKFSVGPGGSAAGFDTSRRGVLAEIEGSLRRLGTDYVDLYLLHWPNWATPVEETLRALDDIVSSGKARYLGACNFPAWRFVEAQWVSRSEHLHRFVVAQNEYSLAQREAEVEFLPALREYGAGFLPYTPLGNGLLTGKYSARTAPPADSRLGTNLYNTAPAYLTPQKLALADALSEFARERGHSLLELAYAWMLTNPSVCSVIAGATSVEQVVANAAAAEGWRLDAEELAAVDKICADSVEVVA